LNDLRQSGVGGMTQGRNPFVALVKNALRVSDLEELVLDHTDMEEIPEGSLVPFPNLRSLYVPFNKLRKLNHLETNLRLQELDARGNRISDLDLSRQLFLTDLYLANNRLQNLSEFIRKIGHLRCLEILDIRGNPAAQEKGSRRVIALKFPDLKILDGIEITQKERNQFGRLLVARPRGYGTAVEFWKSKSLSKAESTLAKRTALILRERQEREMLEKDNRQSEMRGESKNFEASKVVKEAPVPDGMDFLGKAMEEERNRNKKRVVRQRLGLRMFFKAAKCREVTVVTPVESFLQQLCPDVADKAVGRTIDYEPVYPNV
jgi:hypothetical protein